MKKTVISGETFHEVKVVKRFRRAEQRCCGNDCDNIRYLKEGKMSNKSKTEFDQVVVFRARSLEEHKDRSNVIYVRDVLYNRDFKVFTRVLKIIGDKTEDHGWLLIGTWKNTGIIGIYETAVKMCNKGWEIYWNATDLKTIEELIKTEDKTDKTEYDKYVEYAKKRIS
ncbi:MAG: hypothetical protein ACOC5T_02740 [Elusimicrobiota bacterium]